MTVKKILLSVFTAVIMIIFPSCENVVQNKSAVKKNDVTSITTIVENPVSRAQIEHKENYFTETTTEQTTVSTEVAERNIEDNPYYKALTTAGEGKRVKLNDSLLNTVSSKLQKSDTLYIAETCRTADKELKVTYAVDKTNKRCYIMIDDGKCDEIYIDNNVVFTYYNHKFDSLYKSNDEYFEQVSCEYPEDLIKTFTKRYDNYVSSNTITVDGKNYTVEASDNNVYAVFDENNQLVCVLYEEILGYTEYCYDSYTDVLPDDIFSIPQN